MTDFNLQNNKQKIEPTDTKQHMDFKREMCLENSSTENAKTVVYSQQLTANLTKQTSKKVEWDAVIFSTNYNRNQTYFDIFRLEEYKDKLEKILFNFNHNMPYLSIQNRIKKIALVGGKTGGMELRATISSTDPAVLGLVDQITGFSIEIQVLPSDIIANGNGEYYKNFEWVGLAYLTGVLAGSGDTRILDRSWDMSSDRTGDRNLDGTFNQTLSDTLTDTLDLSLDQDIKADFSKTAKNKFEPKTETKTEPNNISEVESKIDPKIAQNLDTNLTQYQSGSQNGFGQPQKRFLGLSLQAQANAGAKDLKPDAAGEMGQNNHTNENLSNKNDFEKNDAGNWGKNFENKEDFGFEKDGPDISYESGYEIDDEDKNETKNKSGTKKEQVQKGKNQSQFGTKTDKMLDKNRTSSEINNAVIEAKIGKMSENRLKVLKLVKFEKIVEKLRQNSPINLILSEFTSQNNAQELNTEKDQEKLKFNSKSTEKGLKTPSKTIQMGLEIGQNTDFRAIDVPNKIEAGLDFGLDFGLGLESGLELNSKNVFEAGFGENFGLGFLDKIVEKNIETKTEIEEYATKEARNYWDV